MLGVTILVGTVLKGKKARLVNGNDEYCMMFRGDKSTPGILFGFTLGWD